MTPSILKRKSTTSDATSAKLTQEVTSEVYDLDRPMRIFDDIRNTFSMRLVQRNDRGVTTTWSVHAADIPGEVVEQSSRKLDAQDRLVRRSTLELVGYGTDSDDTHRESPIRRARRYKRGR